MPDLASKVDCATTPMVKLPIPRRLSFTDGIALLLIAICGFFVIRYFASGWNEATQLSRSHENDKVIRERIGKFGGHFDSDAQMPTGGNRFACRLRRIPLHFELVSAIRFESPNNATPLKRVFSDQPLADALAQSRGVFLVVLKNQLLKEDDLSLLENLGNLQMLTIIDSGLSDTDTAFLAKLPQLESLDLERMTVAGKTIRHLSACPRLRELVLSETDITDSDMLELKNLPQLVTLKVYGTRITGNGLASIARLPNLVRLNIGNTLVDDASLTLLKDAPKLKVIYAGGTKISAQAAKAFERETGVLIEL
jgi:hypothetical protein